MRQYIKLKIEYDEHLVEVPAFTRLDTFLVEALEHNVSRNRIQQLIEKKLVSQIQAPNAPIKSSTKFTEHTKVLIRIAKEQPHELISNNKNVPILFQDDHLAIVVKPAGMTVHPGHGTSNDTLVHSLLAQIDKLSPDELRPGIVHRLDRDTQGLMIIAKQSQSHTALSALFQERQIKKHYHAVLWGDLRNLDAEVEGVIFRNKNDRKKMQFLPKDKYFGEPERVKSAELSYKVVNKNEYFTAIDIDLKTGRTHQIRATFFTFRAPGNRRQLLWAISQ